MTTDPDSELDAARLRNIGIIAHIDAGKTTLSERVLYFSGVERHVGEVHHGSAVMDWMPEERRRGITITAAATSLPWRGHRVNLIDTPGHVDFTVEVERCLRVLDGAVLVLSAVSGVQSQSETVWRHAQRYGVPTITFVNQCDRQGADFLAAVADLERRLEVRAAPVHYPLGEGPEYSGFVDLIEGCAVRLHELGPPRREPIPDEVRDEALVVRSDLIDILAELDERVLECVVEGREPEPELLRAALRRATLASRLQPVLLGSALLHSGVHALLDGVVDYLPSPLDRGPVHALSPSGDRSTDLAPDPAGPLAALVFKVQRIGREELAFLRVVSGVLTTGDTVLVPRLGLEVEVGELLRLHADSGTQIERAPAGEIVAWRGESRLVTGDTLTSPAEPWVLERPVFSEPVLRQVLEPVRADDRTALGQALERIAREDPSLRVTEDPDTGQWILSGMGELHLEVVVGRLSEEFGLDVHCGSPSVAYREALMTTGRGGGRIERHIGDRVVRGELELELAPDPESGRFSVEWAVDPPRSAALRDAIDKALERVAQVGPRFGFPLVHARARVAGLSAQPGPDSDLAYAQAATIALREAMQGASVELLEPVIQLVVTVPEALAPGVVADLAARRARILEQVSEQARRRVLARVPLARLEGYSSALRSLSQGRATCEMEPAGFQAVPEGELADRGLLWV